LPTSSFFFRIHTDDGFAGRLELFALFRNVRALRDAEVWGDWRRRGWLTVPSGR